MRTEQIYTDLHAFLCGGRPREPKNSWTPFFVRQRQTQRVPMLPKSSMLITQGEWWKRFHLVGRKDSFDGNVQILAPVDRIKIGKRNVNFFLYSLQLPKKSGGLMCIPLPPIGGGGPMCSLLRNILPINSMARGTPMDASIARNPPYWAVAPPLPLPTRKFSTAFDAESNSLDPLSCFLWPIQVKANDGLNFWEVDDLQLGARLVVLFPVSEVYQIAEDSQFELAFII